MRIAFYAVAKATLDAEFAHFVPDVDMVATRAPEVAQVQAADTANDFMLDRPRDAQKRSA